MIDLHTHILPGVDDGAGTPQESLEMLRIQKQQGVTAVALTPHFYRDRERPERFFHRRDEAFSRLQELLESLPKEEQAALPKLILGTEVAWCPNIHGWDELPDFCLPGTKRILLELPFAPWSRSLVNQLRDMESRTGVTPILAHVERYFPSQRRQAVQELMDLGFPAQITSGPLLRFTSRGSCLRLLKSTPQYVLGSDCHGVQRRCPDLGPAMDVVRRKAGDAFVQTLTDRAMQLVGLLPDR